MTFKIRESTAIKCVNPKEVHRKKEKVQQHHESGDDKNRAVVELGIFQPNRGAGRQTSAVHG